MPVGAWLDAPAVLLVLLLPLPDDVGAEGVARDAGDKLNVDLVPAFLGPARAVPVGEEGANGSVLARALDAGGETTVSESLVGLDLTRSVVGGGDASDCSD